MREIGCNRARMVLKKEAVDLTSCKPYSCFISVLRTALDTNSELAQPGMRSNIGIYFAGAAMRKIAFSVLTLSIFSFSAAVWAASQVKPGLWEMSMKSDAMKNIPKMTSEQMKQLREMGVNLPEMQDGGMVTKVCISKEMAERDQLPQMNQKESGCETKNYQRTGTGFNMDIICDGPDMKGEGKVKGKFSGSESFTSIYDFKGTAYGQPVDQRLEGSGKWLGTDCGAVQPMTEPMQKK